MNLQAFLTHVSSSSQPEKEWSPALQALWFAEKGVWETAHDCCQSGNEQEGAWVHANLHREEGDLSNARYWYSRAGKPESTASVKAERHEIITTLLGD